MELRLLGLTTNIWKVVLFFSYLITFCAFCDGAFGVTTNVHLLSNKTFPLTFFACFILHNTYHFFITKSKRPFSHVLCMDNQYLSLLIMLAILEMSGLEVITLLERCMAFVRMDDQKLAIATNATITLSGIFVFGILIILVFFIFFVLPILTAVIYYLKTNAWMKKYNFYKHGLGTLDDLMKNNEFIFHMNLLTAAQVSELLIESFNLKSNTIGLHGLITIETDLDSWEYSALYFISEKRPEILKEICNLNSHIHMNIILTSNYNKPFKRTKYYRQILKPFILENYND